MLGQASSLHGTVRPFDPTQKCTDENHEMDFDATVGQLYAQVRERDPADLILEERLDEKDGMLMDGNIQFTWLTCD